MKLSAGQVAALQEYAAKHGRNWKSKLLQDWDSARVPEGPVLRLVRNTIGPSGLMRLKLPRSVNPKRRRRSRNPNPGRVTYGPAHHYRGYGVATLADTKGRVVYMVKPYDGWGGHKDAISFALKSSAEFAAEKTGRRCAVVPLAQNRDLEIAQALLGKK